MDKDALFLFISRFVRDVVSRDVIPMVVDTIVRHRIKISEAIVEKLENWGVAKGFLQEYMEDPNIEVVVGHHPESSEFADNSGKEILDQSSKAESFSDSKDEDNIGKPNHNKQLHMQFKVQMILQILLNQLVEHLPKTSCKLKSLCRVFNYPLFLRNLQYLMIFLQCRLFSIKDGYTYLDCRRILLSKKFCIISMVSGLIQFLLSMISN